MRTRVGVFFGGPSAEHEVSCRSARAVIDNLSGDRYEQVVIGVTRDSRFVLADSRAQRLTATGPEVRLAGRDGQLAVIRDGVVVAEADVVFPVLHGPYGEDGVLQGLLETLGVPYVGCGVLASAVAMDKVAMRRAFAAEGLPMTPYIWATESRWHPGLVAGLRLPLYVKPANLGSSIGVSRVDTLADLEAAAEEAFRYDHVVIVEEGLDARELTCGVLGDADNPVVSVPGELPTQDGWLNHDRKYFTNTGDPLTIPAKVPVEVAERVRELSLRAFRAVDGWGLARVDFLYDRRTGELCVCEINTMPGFTARSSFSLAWTNSGVPFPDLLDRVIDLAFVRHDLMARRTARRTAVPA